MFRLGNKSWVYAKHDGHLYVLVACGGRTLCLTPAYLSDIVSSVGTQGWVLFRRAWVRHSGYIRVWGSYWPHDYIDFLPHELKAIQGGL